MRYLDYLKRFTYTPNEFYDYMIAIEKAMAGDLVLVLTPATLANSAADINAAIAASDDNIFVRSVQVELQAADGTVHEWFTGELAAAVAETTAGDGASAIADSATKVSLENGRGTIDIEYSGAWAGGTKQVETATCAGTVITAGNAKVTVTAAGMTGSPKAISFPVELNDEAADIAAACRAALAADAAVTALFDVSGEGADVVLTSKLAVTNDDTLNIAIADGAGDGASEGVTEAAESTATAAGVAADTQTLTITGGTILGYTVTNKTSKDTLVE
jgi:hypothetical protein